MKRVIQTTTTPNHDTMVLEGMPHETLDKTKAYVNPFNGDCFDGSNGHRLRDLKGNEMEIPKTTWF